MTFEQILVKYLYQTKKVTLLGMGTITLESEVPDNDFINKNKQTRIEKLSLDFNAKAGHDEGFIAFYCTERGKISSLAKSDIDSSLQLVRQMLNIGKSYEIEGLGSIEKQNNGTLVLHAGYFAVPYADNFPKPGRLKEREVVPQNWHKTDAQLPSISPVTKRILVGVGIGILALAGLWFAWSRFQNSKAATTEAEVTLVDTVVNNGRVASIDTVLAPSPDTSSTTPVTALDSNVVYAWKAYIRTYSSGAAAIKGFTFFSKTKNPAIIDSTQPNVYKLYVLLSSSVADTTYKLDSMRKWYASKVVLVKQ